MKGYTYILLCSDGSYYTGSTKYLELRLSQHQSGEGANHTWKVENTESVGLACLFDIGFIHLTRLPLIPVTGTSKINENNIILNLTYQLHKRTNKNKFHALG